ncbi:MULTISPECIES: hypothetical protein [unclassified Nocardiopsis]|uniref:hypothetical protein n=3 Tax=Nocardiopsidaceae TaxID=83676 RepID=UPI00387AA2B9
MGEPTNEPPTEAAPVARVRDAVKVAQGIQAIADRELLVDPETAPDPHVSRLRDRLLRRRQRASLRHRHRTARRAEKAVDFDAAMDDKGHRELRKRQLATSPARKAANLAKIQTAVIGVAVPAVIGFGAASTAGVHAFMTEYAAASAAAAWGYEPAVITLVSGVIIVRALLLRNGAVLPPVVTWIERGALASSVIMCLIGSGVGAIFAPLGVALVSVVVERILAAIADADVGDTPGTATRPVQPRASATVPMTSQVPRWVSVSPGVRVRVGGPRVGNYLTPPPRRRPAARGVRFPRP